MLLGFGAAADGAAGRSAMCVAEDLGNVDIARLLRDAAGNVSSTACARHSPGTPLLRPDF
jgi:hypothetical protein